jgi:hypothetical protein
MQIQQADTGHDLVVSASALAQGQSSLLLITNGHQAVTSVLKALVAHLAELVTHTKVQRSSMLQASC